MKGSDEKRKIKDREFIAIILWIFMSGVIAGMALRGLMPC